MPGNPGGPGRPRKPDKVFTILIPDRSEPVEPASPVGVEWVEYKIRHDSWKAFGSWQREVFVTQKWFNRIMEVYQKMKLLGQDVSIGDAYRKVFPEIVESVANQAGRMPAFPGK